jgi:hypothetical protein
MRTIEFGVLIVSEAWACLVALGIAWVLQLQRRLARGIGAELASPT